MKKLFVFIGTLAFLFSSCVNEGDLLIITQGDYPVKEYYLERDPKINTWGAGIDFVHSECRLSETSLDFAYLNETDDFPLDLNFYIVKAYYYADNGDLKSEGCPAILLSSETKACQIGEGVACFDSLTEISGQMLSQLHGEPEINYDELIDETTGFYDRASLYSALDSCVVGQRFRGSILEVPEGRTEKEVQPVYLIETEEGAYVKFMVVEFKPLKPNDKQTLVRWQVISE